MSSKKTSKGNIVRKYPLQFMAVAGVRLPTDRSRKGGLRVVRSVTLRLFVTFPAKENEAEKNGDTDNQARKKDAFHAYSTINLWDDRLVTVMKICVIVN